MNTPLKIAVTGAAGQISYSLLFRLASGEFAGSEQPIHLHLLEVPGAMTRLEGVKMELSDCAFPCLHQIKTFDNPEECFADIDVAFLVGARPRGPGMERADLMQCNAEIFKVQGQALHTAKTDAKVLVVGNPANTNALITLSHAKTLNPANIMAMMALDQNRAVSMLADKLGILSAEVRHLVVWGNHSATQFPDVSHVLAQGQALAEHPAHLKDTNWENWLAESFRPNVQKRGAKIIEARGSSSAASAASSAIDHMRAVLFGQPDWLSAGALAQGAYGIGEDIVFGFPFACQAGQAPVRVDDLSFSEKAQQLFQANREELIHERDMVRDYIK